MEPAPWGGHDVAKHDDDAGGSALAAALSAPLAAGSLDAALQAARAFFLRHPGDADAKRVVEGIELLIAQVWFGGAEEGEAPDPRFTEAAQLLGTADLDGALDRYAQVEGDRAARARRLALCVRVLKAAAAGAPLPPPERVSLPEPPSFDDETRVAGEGELPLAAFAYDDVTANVDAQIPADAYPEEPTRHLMLGDYELVDLPPASSPVAADEPEDEERTRILQPKQLEALQPKQLEAQPPPPIDDGTREVTRIAGAGELPLEELRRQMEKEAESELDAMIGQSEEHPSVSATPQAMPIEASLVLDIVVDELGPPGAAPPRGPAVPPPPILAPPAPAPPSERAAITPEPPSQRNVAPEPAPAPSEPPAPPPMADERPSRVNVSRSEAALPFVAAAAPTTPEARAHRPSSPDAARVRESSPSPGSVPAPPPAPPPAPASLATPRPDLLSGPPSGVPAPPPAPPPAPASLATPRPDLLSGPPSPAGAAASVQTPQSIDESPTVRGPAVPPAPRGPVVPPAPSADPVHAPIDTSDVALPAQSSWSIREPGAEDEPEEIDPLGDNSWSGVRVYEPEPAAFEPGVAPVDADTWADDEATVAVAPSPEQRAEALAARGELGEALRIYQEEATKRPDEPQLWDRVAEIARMLQQRSS